MALLASCCSCFHTLSEEVHNNRINEDSWLNKYLYSDHYDRVLRTYYDDCINRNSDDSELQASDTESKSTCGRSHEEINHVTASLSQLKLPASSSIYEEFAGDSLEDSETSSSDSIDNLVEYLPALCSSNSDSFHQKYTEKMRFFEVLHHERVYGLDAILNEHIMSPRSSHASSTDFSRQYISWNKMARKLIYVAQLCLSWEALHHQYQKVEALTLSDNSEKLMFHHSVLGKFQEFQVLLERFVEEGQRYSRHKRLSFQGSRRVLDISGFMVEEGYSMGGEAIKATQVLKAIEKCIEAFWSYLKIDNKKSFWKYKGILPIHPPVEDPRDLELLYNVTKAFHKKGKLLKELQGKKKCWLRTKVKPVQEQHEKTNLLFAMIELKLVQKLLKISVISSSHLKWCQEKLNNLEFRHGKVFRRPMNHLFPSS
ncbi:hypothetical protein CDL12_11047 [Handroanthus impetiginosus]|uniref:Uncharacterized protein n=1 Tax=Handroanthus impetiginosus TaxID=429701 RepID=A0A2G9HFJ5_9LAMI|nr:hypothetical protein CDL12_11047 [Handroanthus impetiginosus]